MASWPHWYAPNPYLELLYRTLSTHGIVHVRDVPLDPAAFRGPQRVADVLHLHWLYPLWREGAAGLLGRGRRRRLDEGLARLRAIREAGAALVWTVHNLAPHDGFRRGEEEAYVQVYRLADLRVFHSHSARDEAVRRFGPAPGDTLVCPHGNFRGALPAPRPRQACLRREGLAGDRRTLLCVGQVRHHKGFDLAVRAMASLDAHGYQLVVAGRPTEGRAAALTRLARRRDGIRLVLREIDDQHLSDLLGIADLVLLPYRAVTGSGALLLALTAGRGIVASDLAYFREILVEAPRAGVLVQPESPAALAEGIDTYFASDPAGRAAEAERLASAFEWTDCVLPLASWLRGRRSPGDGRDDE